MSQRQNILIVGSGGREDAIGLALRMKSVRAGYVYHAPGNGGTLRYHRLSVHNDPTDFAALAEFAKQGDCLTICQQDDLLAMGIVDYFREKELPIFGPTKAASKVEWSKVHAKLLMHSCHIPTASFSATTNYEVALWNVRNHVLPVVVKADGLARGKGSKVCRSLEEAEQTLYAWMVQGALGEAGKAVIIEEFLEGAEFSGQYLCFGTQAIELPFIQDHKSVWDGNKGNNTGGMGCAGPVSFLDEGLKLVALGIVKRMLAVLASRGTPFSGILYPGFILTQDGIKVIEWNARGGDPEMQVLIRLLASDPLNFFESCVNGTLRASDIHWHGGYAVSVALCASGYPGEYAKGDRIWGLVTAEANNVVIFHAGTKEIDGNYYTDGGRVLHVTARGDTLEEARARVYEAAGHIRFQGMHYRTDIGLHS